MKRKVDYVRIKLDETKPNFEITEKRVKKNK